MPKKSKNKFHFSSAFIFRLVIFSALFVLSINYLSGQKNQILNDPTVLGSETSSDLIDQIYQLLPPESRQHLEQLNQTALYRQIQDKIASIQSQIGNFPNQQIKEIKKEIINRLYQDIIKNIDQE